MLGVFGPWRRSGEIRQRQQTQARNTALLELGTHFDRKIDSENERKKRAEHAVNATFAVRYQRRTALKLRREDDVCLIKMRNFIRRTAYRFENELLYKNKKTGECDTARRR